MVPDKQLVSDLGAFLVRGVELPASNEGPSAAMASRLGGLTAQADEQALRSPRDDEEDVEMC